jgi:hypothetical protein
MLLEGHKCVPPPSPCLAPWSPSAASGRSSPVARTTDGRMVWSSVPLDREPRVTVAALLSVHKRPCVGISGKPVRSDLVSLSGRVPEPCGEFQNPPDLVVKF